MKARKNRLVRLLCIAAFAAAVLIMPSAAFADDGGDGAEAGTIYWAVDADKNLTISDAEIAAPEGGTAGSFAAKESVSRPWGSQILTAKVTGSPKPLTTKKWFYLCDLTSADMRGLDTSACTDMSMMFYYCDDLTSVDLTGLDTSACTDMSMMFYRCWDLTSLDLSGFNTSACISLAGMFRDCEKLQVINVSSFNTANCTDMTNMFCRCTQVKGLNVSGFNTSKCTSLAGMFSECKVVSALDLRSFDTSKCTKMSHMFERCYALESLTLGESFDTSSCTDLSGLFAGCEKLNISKELLSRFDTSNCESLSGMLSGCLLMETFDLSSLNTSSCTDLSNLFGGCSNLKSIDLRDLNTSSCTGMSGMFRGCSALTELDLSVMDMSACEEAYDMLDGCSNLTKIKLPASYTKGNIIFPCDVDDPGCWKASGADKYCFGYSCIPAGAGTYERVTEGPAKYDAYWALAQKEDGSCELFISPEKLTGDYVNTGAYNTLIDPWGWKDCGEYYISEVTFLEGADGSKVKYNDLSFWILYDDGESCDPYCWGLFRGTGIKTADLGALDASEATTAEGLFMNCQSLETVDMNGMDMSSITDISAMFRGSYGVKSLDMSGLKLSPKLSGTQMFLYNSKMELLITGPYWQTEGWTDPPFFPINMYRADDGSYTEVESWETIPNYEESAAGCNIYVNKAKSEDETVRADIAAAVEAASKIGALGDITSADQSAAIEAARAAYEALTDEQKAYFPDSAINTLDEAEAALETVKKNALKNGDTLTQGYLVYTVTNASKKAVSVKLTAAGKKKAKKANILGTVTIKKTACKVTAIPAKGFANAKKLKKVTGGASLEVVGAKSFFKDKKLKKVRITSATLNTIGAKSFKGCKKLKKLQLTGTTALTKAGVKKSLKESKIKTVKVKKGMKKQYKKIFTKKNCGKKVKVK